MIDFKVDTKFQSPLQYIMHPNIGSSDINNFLVCFDTTPDPKILKLFYAPNFFEFWNVT